MNTTRFVRLLALLLISAGAVAQQTAPSQNEPSASRLQQHVSYLASDALDGRRTGTAGANDAARYIAGEFARLGLKPVKAGGGSRPSQIMPRYLQSFPYVVGVELGQRNEFLFGPTSQRLELREEWAPLGFSTSGNVTASLVFVGYGIKAADLNHNDYEGLPVSGNIALALRDTPDGDNPHGRFVRYVDVRWKAIAARDAGARALVVVAREPNFKEDRLSKFEYDNLAGELGLPILAISQQALAKLAPELNYSELQKLAGAKQQSTVKAIAGQFTIITDVTRKQVAAYNVIGILEGSDPSLKNETIVIGAHYDHLGRGGEGSGSLAPRSGEIHHGADDNASGTAGVLELARLFTSQRPRPKRTIVFMAFGGEEEGLLGSNYYVNHPVSPLSNTVAMINMDMIGRMKDRKLVIGGVGTAKEWREHHCAEGRLMPSRSFRSDA